MAGQGQAQAQAQAPSADEAATAARKLELQRWGTWQGFVITEAHIQWARKSRRIPPVVECRVPPAGDILPSPRLGERVIFLSHLQRGFGLLASAFFRSFLEFYGL